MMESRTFLLSTKGEKERSPCLSFLLISNHINGGKTPATFLSQGFAIRRFFTWDLAAAVVAATAIVAATAVVATATIVAATAVVTHAKTVTTTREKQDENQNPRTIVIHLFCLLSFTLYLMTRGKNGAYLWKNFFDRASIVLKTAPGCESLLRGSALKKSNALLHNET